MDKEDRKQTNYIVGKQGKYPKEKLKEWCKIDNDRYKKWKKIEGDRVDESPYANSIVSVEHQIWDGNINGWWNKDPLTNTKEELLNRINRIINKPYKFREDTEKYFELVKIYKEKFDKDYKMYNFTLTPRTRLITYCEPPLLQCMECGKSINQSGCMITLDECSCGPMFFNSLHHLD